MQVNFQNQMNFPQNESDEEYEIIEIYERDRYDDNELFPFNINFVLPGKSTSYFSSQNQNHSLFNKQNEFSYNGYKQQNNNQNNIRFYSPPSNPPNQLKVLIYPNIQKELLIMKKMFHYMVREMKL